MEASSEELTAPVAISTASTESVARSAAVKVSAATIAEVIVAVSPVVTTSPVTPLGIVITPSIVGFVALNCRVVSKASTMEPS